VYFDERILAKAVLYILRGSKRIQKGRKEAWAWLGLASFGLA
jgi:hypothetical protein